METKVVLGLGFGDEGKGLVTDYLCPQHDDTLVVRFSGGHQSGHTVVSKDGKKHTFAQFGSGTLRGVPTFWSKECTIHPAGMIKEYEALKKLGVDPVIFIDPLAPLTTFYDVFYNKALEISRKKAHGSCGVGFGATIERHESPVKV